MFFSYRRDSNGVSEKILLFSRFNQTRTRTVSDDFGRLWSVSDRFRTVSDDFAPFSNRFGPLQTFLGPFSTRFRTVLDRFGRPWCAFGPFSDDSTPNLKISNFNWPRLGPVRAVPSVRAVPPSRGQLKFEILVKILTKPERKRKRKFKVKSSPKRR